MWVHALLFVLSDTVRLLEFYRINAGDSVLQRKAADGLDL